MPWGERIATVADREGNPVALCQQKWGGAAMRGVTPADEVLECGL
jgi:hypothetical protein